MTRYMTKRVLSSLIALFIFLTFMFFVTQIVITTDFTTQFAMGMNKSQREALRRELGLNQPLWEQYFEWVRTILSGDLGRSFYGPPVIEMLKNLLPPTLLIFFTGTVIAFLLGQWLGRVVAWRKPGFLSGSITFSAIALYTSFPPWLAFLTGYFFVRRFELLPGLADLFGFDPSYNLTQNLRRSIWGTTLLTPQTVMFYMFLLLVAAVVVMAVVNKVAKHRLGRQLPLLFILALLVAGWIGSWFALGFSTQALDVLYHASLPIFTYVLLTFGETMLIMRTSMTDTLKENYISTARAKGLSDRTVRDQHAARNALLPVLSRLVISLPYLLTGLVILEKALNWPGISGSLFDSMYNQDIPVVMGALLIVGLLSAAARLVLDILYVYLDPRLRFDSNASGRIR